MFKRIMLAAAVLAASLTSWNSQAQAGPVLRRAAIARTMTVVVPVIPSTTWYYGYRPVVGQWIYQPGIGWVFANAPTVVWGY